MNAAPVYDQPSAPKLPINIAWRAFVYVIENFGSVMKIGLLPLLLIVASNVLIYIYFPPQMVDIGGRLVPKQEIWPSLTILPINLIATTIFIVGVHRLAVLGEKPASYFQLRFQREEIKYFVVALIITLILFGVIGIAAGIAYLIGPVDSTASNQLPSDMQMLATIYFVVLVVFVLLIWPIVRLALTFPHAAIAGQIDFGVSWRAMKGNFWRFVLITLISAIFAMTLYFIAALAIGLTVAAIASVVLTNAPGAVAQAPSGVQIALIAFIPMTFFVFLIGFFQAVSVTVLSFSYQALVLRNYEVVA